VLVHGIAQEAVVGSWRVVGVSPGAFMPEAQPSTATVIRVPVSALTALRRVGAFAAAGFPSLALDSWAVVMF
jgi:hypothetical protein